MGRFFRRTSGTYEPMEGGEVDLSRKVDVGAYLLKHADAIRKDLSQYAVCEPGKTTPRKLSTVFPQECEDAEITTEAEPETPGGPSESDQTAKVERENKREFARIQKSSTFKPITIRGLTSGESGLLKGVCGKYWGKPVRDKKQARFVKDATSWCAAKKYFEETKQLGNAKFRCPDSFWVARSEKQRGTGTYDWKIKFGDLDVYKGFRATTSPKNPPIKWVEDEYGFEKCKSELARLATLGLQ